MLVLTTRFLRNKRSLQRYCRRFLFVVSCVNVDAGSASGNGHTLLAGAGTLKGLGVEWVSKHTKGPDKWTVTTVWCKNAVKSLMAGANVWYMLGFSFPSPQKIFFLLKYVCVRMCMHACVCACVFVFVCVCVCMCECTYLCVTLKTDVGSLIPYLHWHLILLQTAV